MKNQTNDKEKNLLVRRLKMIIMCFKVENFLINSVDYDSDIYTLNGELTRFYKATILIKKGEYIYRTVYSGKNCSR